MNKEQIDRICQTIIFDSRHTYLKGFPFKYTSNIIYFGVMNFDIYKCLSLVTLRGRLDIFKIV